MQPLAGGQETTVCLVAGSSAVRIEADPVQLTVALRSLCQNALEALGHRGRIEVAVNREGNEASIAVADDGPGILARAAAAHLRALLFRPAGRPRCRHGAVEVLANRDPPRGPDRGWQSCRGWGSFTIRLPLGSAAE